MEREFTSALALAVAEDLVAVLDVVTDHPLLLAERVGAAAREGSGAGLLAALVRGRLADVRDAHRAGLAGEVVRSARACAGLAAGHFLEVPEAALADGAAAAAGERHLADLALL